jgi:hypothetical protein
MIIWGSKAKVRQIGSGKFFCPNCLAESPHAHFRISRYFTLYFIPLFPTSALGQYVKCETCGREFPDTVLTCTREEILKATEPWTCSKCKNRNPRSTARCLACGATQAQPPPLPSSLPPPIPSAPSAVPPVIPARPGPRARLSLASKAVIGAASFLLLLFLGFFGLRVFQLAKYMRQPHPATATGEFYRATDRIGPHGETASGNSTEASGLAEKMVAAMTAIRAAHFTVSTEKSLIDQRDNFKIYCDLRSDQCVFLVHVPELRRFQAEAKASLGNYAWRAAREVLQTSHATNQPMKLGLGLRGVISYDRVMIGSYTPGVGAANLRAAEVKEGFGCEKHLAPWFARSESNSPPILETESQRTAL